MTQPNIRTANTSDIDKIAEIFEHPSVVEQSSQHPHFGAERVSRLFNEQTDNLILLVGEIDGCVEGYLSLHLNTKPRSKHVAAIGMAVHPRKKGRGLGKALLKEAINTADTGLNIVRLELEVYTDNDIAINLYKKMGFHIEGERAYCGFKNGNFIGTYLMARINTVLLPASVSKTEVPEQYP